MNKKYLSEHNEFKDLIKITSEKMGLDLGIVEKDYWITRVLRELSLSEFASEFIFKGGTCLSKVWLDSFGRFSEDIDLLLLQTDLTVKRANKTQRLKEFINFVAAMQSISFIQDTSSSFESKPGIIGGKFYYNYPSQFRENCPECIKPEILLEPGYRGGSHPFSSKQINSLIAAEIINYNNGKIPEELNDFKDDIIPFNINVLNPERIFLEKLDAIKNMYKRNMLSAGTRHYYDIYNLLKVDSVKNLINQKEELGVILADISSISQQYYGVKDSLTIESIRTCEAFSPEFSGFDDLKKKYESEKGIYYLEQPDFKIMLNEISDFLNSL